MSAPVGIIGGTALAGLSELAAVRSSVPKTNYGRPSGPLIRGRLAGVDACFVMRHGRGHTLAPHRINYRANIAALAKAGCESAIGVAAVGGITPDMGTGRVVVPDQIIDYTWGRAHTFYDSAKGGALDHVDFTRPYSQLVRSALVDAADRLRLQPAPRAVHGITQGPRLETAAEIDRMERDGCDIVGMTGMPEAALAREAGLAFACLALVVNRAAGRGDDGTIHTELEETLARAMADAEDILVSAVALL